VQRTRTPTTTRGADKVARALCELIIRPQHDLIKEASLAVFVPITREALTPSEPMAEATRSLSPKRAAERLRKLRSAIRTMVLYKAKKTVKLRLQSEGLKVSHYSAKEIVELAEQYIAKHLEELVNEATASVCAWPEFRALKEQHDRSHNQAGPIQNNPGASSAGPLTQEPVAQ
jgi:hypothetical protein